jgi:SMC interacting uncharacterized protein involved in chromosome segregation
METNETVNQENTENTQERTFTQAEVDRIIKDRLERDHAKYSDYEELKEKASKYDEFEEASKSELEKATEKAKKLQSELDTLKKANKVRDIRSSVASEMGVPVELLSGDDEDSCKAQAEAILKFAKPSYPNVKDGGETTRTSSGSTRDQFAKWMESTLK